MFCNKIIFGRLPVQFDYMYRKYYKTDSSTKEINVFDGMKVSHLALESKTDSK